MIDEKLLEQKLAAIETARAWSPRSIAKLEALVRGSDEFALFRVNPLLFAADKGFSELESIDLFLHAARQGLFEMDWLLLCGGCGDVVESFGTLKTLDASFRCDICHDDYEATLDDRIEISFTVNPKVRPIAFHTPEALNAEDYYFKYQFRQNVRLGNGMLFTDLYRSLLKVNEFLAPGETKRFTVEALPGGLIAVADRFQHAELVAPVSAERKSGQTLKIVLRDGKFDPGQVQLAAGPVELEFTNASDCQGSVFLASFPEAALKAPKTPLDYGPYLSGSRLLSNQTFRNLFRSEVIQGAEGIRVNDLTVVFTDLKGSTALYDRIGDLKAFSLVHRHFEDLGKAIAANNGAIVKTIGDAVMASFTNPKDAVLAAQAMLTEIARVNGERGNKDLVLKIGMHKGPSIAVTLNDRLDYFGQNINLAARVQALAGADEICVTREVYDYPGVRELLGGRRVDSSQAALKGIQKEVTVYKVQPAAATLSAA